MRKKIVLLNLLTVMFILLMGSQANADILGIDVSRWQGNIDWQAASSVASFAMIKAGGGDEGMYTDGQFARNRDETRRIGIPRGFYYYAGGGDPVQEADYFADTVGPLLPGEVLALDLEIDNPDPVSYSLAFLTRTEQLTGVKPYLYTNMKRVWSHDWQPVAASGYPLWGAIYDGTPLSQPAAGAWPGLTMKQYCSSGVVPGITSGTVDMNVFISGVADFQSLGQPAVKPKPKAIQESRLQPLPVPAQAPAGEDKSTGNSNNTIIDTRTDLDSSSTTGEEYKDTPSGIGAPLAGTTIVRSLIGGLKMPGKGSGKSGPLGQLLSIQAR